VPAACVLSKRQGNATRKAVIVAAFASMSVALRNCITALGVHLAELHQQLFGSFSRNPDEVLLEACMTTDDTAHGNRKRVVGREHGGDHRVAIAGLSAVLQSTERLSAEQGFGDSVECGTDGAPRCWGHRDEQRVTS
jgi:hypothetical protein